MKLSFDLLRPTARMATEEPTCPLDLLIIYDTAHSRERAMALCNDLDQQLTEDYELKCAWCSVAQLSESRAQEAALGAARDAQMIIVCMKDSDTIPSTLQWWIHGWLEAKRYQCSALVALLGKSPSAPPQSSALHVYLEQAAGLAGMDFFSHSYELPPEAPLLVRQPRIRPEQTFAADDLLPRPMPFTHWGINE